jgi:hypothetical protein
LLRSNPTLAPKQPNSRSEARILLLREHRPLDLHFKDTENRQRICHVPADTETKNYRYDPNLADTETNDYRYDLNSVQSFAKCYF